MTALQWIRSRARERPELSDTIEVDGITYASTTQYFMGNLPAQMKRGIDPRELIRDDLVHETLRVPPGRGQVEFFRTTYAPIDAAK